MFSVMFEICFNSLSRLKAVKMSKLGEISFCSIVDLMSVSQKWLCTLLRQESMFVGIIKAVSEVLFVVANVASFESLISAL